MPVARHRKRVTGNIKAKLAATIADILACNLGIECEADADRRDHPAIAVVDGRDTSVPTFSHRLCRWHVRKFNDISAIRQDLRHALGMIFFLILFCYSLPNCTSSAFKTS
jgi:hypothetical protein